MKTLGITLGDPCGVGPEISAKALEFFSRKKLPYSFVVIGNKKSFLKACNISGIEINKLHCLKEFIDFKAKIEYKNSSSLVGGEVSYQAICMAAELFKEKKIQAMVTAPISKQSLHLAGHHFDGHTGLLASLFNVKEPYLMLANKKFNTLHVTCHMSLLNAIKSISQAKVLKTIEIGHRHLLKLGIKKPRIGLCGLNPHASEEGIFGQEEEKHLTPAVLKALDLGIDIVGPISPDIIFREANKGQYDLIIANYHDQGHIPVKLLYFDQSVNVTLGVPFIITSVDHGTAYDIAYKNIAKARNMVAAIIYALKMINN